MFCHPQEDILIEEVKDIDHVNETKNVDSKNEVIDGMAPGFKPSSNESEWISSRPQMKLPQLEICEPEKKQTKVKNDENCETNLQTSPSTALENTNITEKEKNLKDGCSHPQVETFESHKSSIGIKKHREILADKPRALTKSNNIEKGKEKDEEEIFCHPQEHSPIGEVKDSDIMNNTPNADSKNEVIAGMAPGL